MQIAFGAIQTRIVRLVRQAADGMDALEQAVVELEQSIPYYTWVGVYVLQGSELVLGPFRGKPSPHTRIPIGRGICGAAAAHKQTIVVDDVNADDRYLACSLETRSEIVVPIMHGDTVIGEIDVDSDRAAAFGSEDRSLLEAIGRALAERMSERSIDSI